MAGREVFLFVNDDLIENLGGAGSVSRFVAAVEQGPPWVDQHLGLCQRALSAFEGWRERRLRYPPYVGYLGLFVLAVGLEGEFAPHAYYARLRTLLAWPDVDAGAPPSFDRMLRLWEDLEVWSNHDMDGDLGVFSIRITGEWIHVGLPKAQAVLTEHERRALPAIFTAASLDPMAPPSDSELAQHVRRHGTQVLRARTLRLISDRSSEPELFAVLLDAFRAELAQWDGEGPASDEAGAYGVAAVARICLRLDEIARRMTATLRIAARADFPEDGLTLESGNGSMRLTCHEYLPGWSSPLADISTGQDADAAGFDWSDQLILADRAAGWRVRVPSSRVRIFVSGLPLELPGLVEVRSLPLKKPFFLAAINAAVPALEGWADSGQVHLEQVDITDGLPPGWTLFKSRGATGDEAIRKTLPGLALPSVIRLRMDGGIRSGQGNTYFKFAPPTIVIEGASGDEELDCAGRRLKSAAEGSATFALPADLPTGARLTVEVSRHGNVLRRQSLFLSDEFDWRLGVPVFAADRFGVVHEWGGPAAGEIAGALGGSERADPFPVRPCVRSDRRLFIVGRRPGEIRRLPAQGAHPEEWHPVWLIELGRRGRAEYCGLDLAQSRPAGATAAPPDACALWKDILWHRRKRIEPPHHPVLRELWRDYVELAKRV